MKRHPFGHQPCTAHLSTLRDFEGAEPTALRDYGCALYSLNLGFQIRCRLRKTGTRRYSRQQTLLSNL